MKDDKTRRPSRPLSTLAGRMGAERLSALLSLGVSGPPRPVDDLISRLEAPDGEEWLKTALACGPLAAFGSPVEEIALGGAGLDRLRSIKERCKALFHRRGSEEEARRAGLLGYLLASAAARVHRESSISSRGDDELREAWLDLATVMPEPWADLLSRAALAAAEGRSPDE